MQTILLNDGLDQEIIEKLQPEYDIINRHYPKTELLEKIKEVDCIVIRSKTKIDKDIIDASLETNRLKLIIRAGVGLDNVDLTYAKAKGITVKNTPKASTQVVAELTISFMLSLSRNIPYADYSMKQMAWEKKSLVGSELFGKTLGIVGFGRIGRKVADFASIFDMHIIYYDVIKSESDYEQVDIKTLFKESDYITLHAPAQNKPFIHDDMLHLLKHGVKIINTSRGNAIDEAALIRGIDRKIISGAALDVYEREPNQNKDLVNYKEIILTPHIGANTTEATKRIGYEVYDTILKFKERNQMTNKLKVGMPALMEFQTIEENIDLAVKLKLDFLELNMNFLYCYPSDELREKLVEAQKMHGLAFTFHYYDNVDISSPNPNYMNYLKADMKLIGEKLKGLIFKIVLHIEPGSFMTIFSEKHYVYKYDQNYVERTVQNVKDLEAILNPFDIMICLENVPIHPYMENLYKSLQEAGCNFTWDIGHDVIYEHYLYSTYRNKYKLNIRHMHMHNVLDHNDHQRLTLGKLNIKEYIKYAILNDVSVVIEVKDKENLDESVLYLRDYIEALGNQEIEDHIWTPS